MTGDKVGKRAFRDTIANCQLALTQISINIKDIGLWKARGAVGKVDYDDKLLAVLQIAGVDLLLSLSFY